MSLINGRYSHTCFLRPGIGFIFHVLNPIFVCSAARGRALDTAFQDLSTLMGQAQDMVSLAERFRAAAARGAAQQEGEPEDAWLHSQVADELSAMGFGAPVTKQGAGARYHHSLARQARSRAADQAAASPKILRSRKFPALRC